jgi:hypothetical protein
MDPYMAFGLSLAAISTTLTNLGYLREQVAAAALPALSLRRPLQSLRLLLADRGWVVGFAMESTGFASYAAALALAPLAVVQSVDAGGIGLLAYASAKLRRRRLGSLQSSGVAISMLGLLLLGVSLANSSGGGGRGSTGAILVWLGGSTALVVLVLLIGRGRGVLGAALGVAGGLLFSIGDFSTKLATQGGTHFAFIATVIVGYALGSAFLQLGYQRDGALTVAGLATLLTNALPILAAAIVLKEPVPSGALGVARVLAFVAVTLGAVLLSAPDAETRGRAAVRAPKVAKAAPAGQAEDGVPDGIDDEPAQRQTQPAPPAGEPPDDQTTEQAEPFVRARRTQVATGDAIE